MEDPGREPLIAVVVVARNEAATVGSCLSAARRALEAAGGGEILMVDSASRDRTAEIGMAAGCRVLSVRTAARMTPAAMRWIGAAQTRSRLLLFLDGDCQLEPEFLPAALAAMESEASLGVVAGGRRDFHRTAKGLAPAGGEYYAGGRAAPRRPAYGGCALYRRAALEAAGSFDPFLRAKEEEDLAQRITRAGYRIAVLPVPMIRHVTVPRESLRRLARSLAHGFYVGRGQAMRVFLGRGEYRAAFRDLDRVFLMLGFLLLGMAGAVALARGISWPASLWLFSALVGYALFAVRSGSLSKPAYYATEWIVQGACLFLGFLTPSPPVKSFRWEGTERASGAERPADLPKVLLVAPLPAPPFRGGVEKGVDLLLKGDLARRTSMQLFNTYREQDPTRRLWSRLRYQAGMIRSFRKKLQESPPDLIHIKTSAGINFYQNALYASMGHFLGFPVLLQIHTGRFESFYRGRSWAIRAWIRRVLSRCTGMAALSRSWAERLSAIAPQATIRIVPNGLGEDELDRLSAGGEIRPSQIFFLGTGRKDLNRDKGLHDLLAVVPELARRHPQSRWVLAGLEAPEETREDLRRNGLDREGDEGRILCLGALAPEDREKLLLGSSLLVLPSYYENMPNILLEAMAAGMGVVATDVGAIPEMLGYGEGGLVVAPGDRAALAQALDRLLSAPTLVRAQGKRNRSAITREYTMSEVERKLAVIYREFSGWPEAVFQESASGPSVRPAKITTFPSPSQPVAGP
ncbi:MAG TPA: glycosyltransferase [Candidatus Polarisedimenticolia bacterium]|nr:glycosyltransferase [Candidatus Polarisedimenticolia bacterium]